MSLADAALSPSVDQQQQRQAFREDILAGLSGDPKWVSCKYLYDKRGSELFDQICQTPEYYVTRTELAIMRQHAGQMAAQLGPGVALVEYGSGSSLKTRLLLDHLEKPACYVPVDVSGQHLQESCAMLAADYPDLAVLPVTADFTQPFELPAACDAAERAVVYFPGSTIGNLTHEESCQLLAGTRDLCGEGGEMLLGMDLQKDPAVIHAAYNDAQGVTAEFNLNLLRRINRELDGNFDVQAFRFEAAYNARRGRVESALVSQRDQRVTIDGREFEFTAGEPIRTEYSHKYTIPQFERLALEAGFTLQQVWTDAQQYFAVVLLTSARA